ncbi:branched-chain amino acid ABC transporter permease [Oricola indica]|jgi:branched-chain amino acid transport system permease protein|uniref:branched-chain amino acid ABC transporter permease n=1 Tax=Oricola indica TaxID=2872591 RepID=UPI003CCBC07A
MDWVSTIVNGLLIGSLYGLFGLGLAFAFGIMRIVNVAHGEFIVLAAYIGYFLSTSLGLPPALNVIVVALIGVAIGYLLQAGLLNRVIGADPLRPLILTFGLSIIMRNAMAELFGADLRSIDAGALKTASVDFGGLSIGVLPLVLFVVTAACFGLLFWIIRQTRFGRNIRAAADDADTIEIFGVDHRRIYAAAMGIAIAMSCVAGVLLGMRSGFTPFSGVDRLLIALEVVIIGGAGSMFYTFFGGLLLGVAHLVGLKFDPGSGLLFAHLTFLAVLLFRPQGFAGVRT